MLLYNFDWLAYVNHDMENYAFDATRLYESSFAAPPTVTAINHDIDFSHVVWALFVFEGERVGADLLLSIVMGITHDGAFAVYMPTYVAVMVSLLCATGALVLGPDHNVQRAMWASILCAVSPLNAFTTFVQHMPQELGICFTAGLMALTESNEYWDTKRNRPRGICFVVALLCFALLATYPELIPVLLLAAVLYVIFARSAVWSLRPVAAAGLTIGVIVAALGNSALQRLLIVCAKKVSMGAELRGHDLFLFPYYFLPTGFANLFGYLALSTYPPEPIKSVVIILGLLTFAFTLTASLILVITRQKFYAALCFAMLLMFTEMVVTRVPYGTFKMAMYMQFAIAAVIASFWRVLLFEKNSTKRWRPLAITGTSMLIVIYSGFAGASLTRYYNQATDWTSDGAYKSMPEASRSRMLSLLNKINSELPRNSIIVSDAPTAEYAYFLSLLSHASTVVFLTQDYFTQSWFHQPTDKQLLYADRRYLASYLRLAAASDAGISSFLFGQSGSDAFAFKTDARYNSALRQRGATVWFLTNGSRHTVLNRTRKESPDRFWVIEPLRSLENHLVFINSPIGYAEQWQREPVGLWSIEPDPFGSGTFAAVGRGLLLQIINPTRRFRVVLNLTTTPIVDARKLPRIVIEGRTTVVAQPPGAGSVRLVSDPVEPKFIDGKAYILLRFEGAAHKFKYPRSGLFGLYGADIELDSRSLVGFVRDISAIADSRYRSESVPESVQIPSELTRRGMEYSGIFEEGWTSQEFSLRLLQRRAELKLRGFVPLINDNRFQSNVKVSIDGKLVYSGILAVGNFELNLHTRSGAGPHVVNVRFARFQVLPNGDGRRVGAMLLSASM
jgi:hypothetical protein